MTRPTSSPGSTASSAAAQANTDWNDDHEKEAVLDQLSQARKIYQDLAK